MKLLEVAVRNEYRSGACDPTRFVAKIERKPNQKGAAERKNMKRELVRARDAARLL